eukprot:GEMP01037455.1.p1 GENE.GEMP01037455.1~~GEMP01037455.1.p1  ORF type:complete len:337 (+),score=66.76 GEMP01037455.1:276-1286(+)
MQQPLLDGRRVRDFEWSDVDGSVKCVGGCAMFGFMMCSLMIGVVEVNHIAIWTNKVTGTVYPEPVYGAGLYFSGPFYSFISFPSTLMTVDFANTPNADRPPVSTRTGADPSDPDSGGQPISISTSFQYRFNPERIGACYLDFGSRQSAHSRFLQLAFNKISTLAQEFNPTDFWVKRDIIARHLHVGVNKTLWEGADQGATVDFFQILRVDFATRYEDTITQIQVAEQQKVVNEYKQQVEEVIQQIANMNASNEAQMTNVTANGNAVAALIVATANKDGFHLKQTAKAQAYQEFKTTLHFSENQMVRYFQIKSLQQQSMVTVGLPSPTTQRQAKHEL